MRYVYRYSSSVQTSHRILPVSRRNTGTVFSRFDILVLVLVIVGLPHRRWTRQLEALWPRKPLANMLRGSARVARRGVRSWWAIARHWTLPTVPTTELLASAGVGG